MCGRYMLNVRLFDKEGGLLLLGMGGEVGDGGDEVECVQSMCGRYMLNVRLFDKEGGLLLLGMGGGGWGGGLKLSV